MESTLSFELNLSHSNVFDCFLNVLPTFSDGLDSDKFGGWSSHFTDLMINTRTSLFLHFLTYTSTILFFYYCTPTYIYIYMYHADSQFYCIIHLTTLFLASSPLATANPAPPLPTAPTKPDRSRLSIDLHRTTRVGSSSIVIRSSTRNGAAACNAHKRSTTKSLREM